MEGVENPTELQLDELTLNLVVSNCISVGISGRTCTYVSMVLLNDSLLEIPLSQ